MRPELAVPEVHVLTAGAGGLFETDPWGKPRPRPKYECVFKNLFLFFGETFSLC